MKVKTIVQYNEKEVVSEELVKLAKEALKEKDVKMVSIDTLDLYYKPEEVTVYYVATLKDGTEETGSVEVEA